jgi:hypothetical protein
MVQQMNALSGTKLPVVYFLALLGVELLKPH